MNANLFPIFLVPCYEIIYHADEEIHLFFCRTLLVALAGNFHISAAVLFYLSPMVKAGRLGKVKDKTKLVLN